jgi:hypothetical protein
VPVATRLFAIYSDELGNGDLTKNHAGIYRRLLESLQIQCAPIETLEFAASERFLDAAFDLPVLLLSIALNTHRFLPELLGLNLAIEVSGLGLAYSQLARDLDYWGIDPKIVRLHQSIDNFASGHAAIAREAIVLHLREVGALGGDSAQQANWRRVNRGYGLLNEATRRLKRSMVASFLARQALGWVRRSLPPTSSL